MHLKVFLYSFGFVCISCANTNESTTENPGTITVSPIEACRNASDSCEECVKITKCYYCTSSKQCLYYPYKHIIPKSDECDLGNARWGVCWFNFKAMIITVGVLAGIIFISCTICICCCCRRKKNNRLIKENAKREREREERRIRNQEKQKERDVKYNEIRRKYGLIKDDHPYQRFEA